MPSICLGTELTLSTSGALSNGGSLCPQIWNSTSNQSYFETMYAKAWNELADKVTTYNTLYDPPSTGTGGPSFGIHFVAPGSSDPPMRCGDANPGATCVFANQSSFFPNVTALRKLYYDTEGAHYDSEVKACSTIHNNSQDASSDSHFKVVSPEDYDASCADAFCTVNGTGLFDVALRDLTQKCAEKAILTVADAMWQSSFMGDCSYVAAAAETILESGGACDTAGNGFVYLFSTLAYASVIYIILLLVAYMGMNMWEAKNYEEVVKLRNAKLGDSQQDTGMNFTNMSVNRLAGMALEDEDKVDLSVEDLKDDNMENKEYIRDSTPLPTALRAKHSAGPSSVEV